MDSRVYNGAILDGFVALAAGFICFTSNKLLC